jgi:hypothetical protein
MADIEPVFERVEEARGELYDVAIISHPLVNGAIIRDVRLDPRDLACLESIARLGVRQNRGGIPHVFAG